MPLLSSLLSLLLLVSPLLQLGMPWPGPGTAHSASGALTITFVQSTGNFASTGTTTNKAYTSSTTAGHLLIGIVISYNASDTPVITDSQTNTWSTAATFSGSPVLTMKMTIFYLANCPGGADTVTGSWASSAGGELHIAEFAGAAASSPLDQTGDGSNASGPTATTSSMTPSVNGELIVGYCGIIATGSIGSGWTLITSQDGDLSEFKIQTTATPVQATWNSSSGWAAIGATFKPGP